METVLITRTELVTVTTKWWKCMNPEHRHQTKPIAEACIERTIRIAAKPKYEDFWTVARKREVFTFILNGGKIVDAAKAQGSSQSAVDRVFRKMLFEILRPLRNEESKDLPSTGEVSKMLEWNWNVPLGEIREHSKFLLEFLDKTRKYQVNLDPERN